MDIRDLKNNKWARRAAEGLGGVLLLWALGWLLVPPVIKHQAQRIASDSLGRGVTIGAVDFKPWTLELTLSDLAIATADGKTDQLRVKRIHVDAELESLWRWAPVVDAVVVDEPVARLTHLGGGRYDLDDVLHKLQAEPGQPAREPAKFALYNLALNGGSFDFVDTTVEKTHTVRDLRVAVPFLSNLASKREVKTEPLLAFKLNGAAFNSAGQSTPFAQTHKTDATFSVKALDLRPYLGYLPAGLPVRLQAAVLDADLKVAFEENPTPVVRLSGVVQSSHVKLTDASNKDLLALDILKLSLADVRPLARTAKLSALELSGPVLAVHRTRDGRLNLDLARPPVPASGVASVGKSAAPGTWKLDVAQLTLRQGRVDWTDDTAASPKGAPARLSLSDVLLHASGIAVSGADAALAPVPFEGSALLSAPGLVKDSAPAPTRLNFNGTASADAAQVAVAIHALPLSIGAPYLAQWLEPTLGGQLDAALRVSWQAAREAGRPDPLMVDLERLNLAQIALTRGKLPLATVRHVELNGSQIDLAAQSAVLGKLTVDGPKLTLERDADGRWMFQRWHKAKGAKGTDAPLDPSGAVVTPARWKLAVNDLELKGGALAWRDSAPPRPVALDLSAVQLRLQHFALDGNKPATLQVAARVGAGRAEAGRFSYRGSVGLNPLAVQGTVEAVDLPVHALEPYFAETLNVELLRADASFKGALRYADSSAGPRLRVSGDMALEDLRANTLPTQGLGEELLSWRVLSLRGLDVSLAPGSATTVDVKETALSDFFARVLIQENGRINLQDLIKAAPTGNPVVSAAANASPPPVINIGPVSLLNGKVHFSDRFVKPNYSANLTELVGKLSAFSSVVVDGAPQLADLELRGRAEGTASLEVLGKLNPVATPLALDIKGKVRDLELPPLSPYSIKYAGHGIERGKLSVDVAYLVLPNGQLTASNQLILNQLSFGDPVAGAPASLPVKLAVALLADRHGVIDINLPISGSLNDPQFRVGPIIFKLIVNLIVKAITSPFSLLASALGGGGDELSSVTFAPGSAVLTAEATQGLDKVAQALVDRPALKMTVLGTAALEVEREGYKRERLQALVRAEKRRSLVVGGTAADASASVTVSSAEYPELLKAVYKRADMPKPRNFVGLLKDITQPEMQALLLAHIPATEEAMRELATQRGVVVRDYLATRQLPLERLFLGAPRSVDGPASATSAPAGAAAAPWRPHAELVLSAR